MALTPTEREEHFFKAMVDAADGSTPEELEPTERKEHWYKEIIDAIAAGGGGSGGGSSGGGDVVVSHITADVSGDELVYSCDMTESEIEEALDAGKTVLAVFAKAVSIWTMLSSPVADFITIFTRGNTILYNSFVFSDGSLQRVSNSYTLTPAT